MKLSIIIPTYNGENYIVRCLESLHKQSIKDVEFLIINDGSKDNTEKKIKDYLNSISDNRFKYYLKKNGGQADARNFGIKKARGKYIFFVDSDDEIVENHTIIENLLNLAEQNQLDILDFNFEGIKGGKYQPAFSKNRNFNKITTGVEFYSNLVKKTLEFNDVTDYPTVWHFLYRKEFILNNSIKFPVGKLCEDVYWTAQTILKAKKMMCVYECGYRYYIHENSTMTNKNLTLKRISDYLDILFELKEEILKLNISELEISLVHHIFNGLFELIVDTGKNINNKDIKKLLGGFNLTFKDKIKKRILLMPNSIRKIVLAKIIRGS